LEAYSADEEREHCFHEIVFQDHDVEEYKVKGLGDRPLAKQDAGILRTDLLIPPKFDEALLRNRLRQYFRLPELGRQITGWQLSFCGAEAYDTEAIRKLLQRMHTRVKRT
jgi:hypothetical protein